MQTLQLSSASQYLAAILLLSIVTIEIGGWYMTTIVRGRQPLTEFQKAFARAGHAHAGVLVSLSLICLLLADAAALDGFFGIIVGLDLSVRCGRSCLRRVLSCVRDHYQRTCPTHPSSDLSVRSGNLCA